MLTQGERSELILDRYRLGQRVGAGAAGSVHAAEDTQLGQSVVIKLFDGQADGFSAWHDEMRLILRMSHPNIVPCLDIGFDERLGMWTLVFARQQGGSLRRWMVDPARTEPLPIRDILRDVASALSFAHRKGVIHRDVKAENILAEQASAGTRWLLCDFGSGRFLTPGSRAQSLAGSAFYMAPEVFTGEATALSDQYSLGVLGIELLTKTLLHEQDLQRFVSQHRGQPTLHGVLAQLVEKDPLLRYPNLDSFLALLNQRESTMVENSSEDLLLTEYLQTRRNQTAQQIDELKKQWVAYERISPHLKRAIIASEDARFVDHEGFDWEGIQKAMEKNQKRGRTVAGGSTISQQLAKNLFLTPTKSYFRKAEEAIITLMLENLWSKRRIFEVYLNAVSYTHLTLPTNREV